MTVDKKAADHSLFLRSWDMWAAPERVSFLDRQEDLPPIYRALILHLMADPQTISKLKASHESIKEFIHKSEEKKRQREADRFESEIKRLNRLIDTLAAAIDRL